MASIVLFSNISYFKLNLHNDYHCYYAYILNGTNILIASSINKILPCKWLLSYLLFGIDTIYPNKYSHALWHLICHHIIYETYNLI